MLTRKGYDNFKTKLHDGICNTLDSSCDFLSSIKSKFTKPDPLEGVKFDDIIDWGIEHFIVWIVFVLINIVIFLLIVLGALGLEITPFWFFIAFVINLFLAAKQLDIFTKKLIYVNMTDWWWVLFAYSVDPVKVFGLDNQFYGTYKSIAVNLLEEFLLEHEPELGLWAISYHNGGTRAFFMQKSDILYLKLKYYGQNFLKVNEDDR